MDFIPKQSRTCDTQFKTSFPLPPNWRHWNKFCKSNLLPTFEFGLLSPNQTTLSYLDRIRLTSDAHTQNGAVILEIWTTTSLTAPMHNSSYRHIKYTGTVHPYTSSIYELLYNVTSFINRYISLIMWPDAH